MGRAGTFVVVALIVGAVTFLIAGRDDPGVVSIDVDATAPDDTNETESPEATSLTPAPPAEEVPPGFDRYEADTFYFDHPESWSVDELGTAVEITAPDSRTVMSFGLAPRGDIRSGIGKFVELINESYDVLDVRGPTTTTVGIGSSDAVLVEGAATNAEGVRLDFRLFVVEGDDEHVAIAIFTTSRADESDIEAVLDSFSTLTLIQS